MNRLRICHLGHTRANFRLWLLALGVLWFTKNLKWLIVQINLMFEPKKTNNSNINLVKLAVLLVKWQETEADLRLYIANKGFYLRWLQIQSLSLPKNSKSEPLSSNTNHHQWITIYTRCKIVIIQFCASQWDF